MLRLIVLLFLLVFLLGIPIGASAALPPAAPLHPSPAFQPRGHYGVYDPAFDKLFGARIIRFLDPDAKRTISTQSSSP